MKKDSGKRLASGKTPAAGGKIPKPKKKKRRLSWQQIMLIILVVLLAIALAGVLLWKRLFVRPELPVAADGGAPVVSSGGSPANTSPGSGIDYGEGIRPRGGDGERKSKDYWTVLILGRDTGGGGNTDTMLLASYDVTNQKATVMSIPRDTMVNVPWDIKRINSVYNYYGGDEKGIKALYKEIAQLVGFEPDFQVVVEWEAVGEIVDAMGGVYYDVPRNMNYDDPFQDLHIHQTKGYRLLTGSDAMQVLRYRHDNNNRYGYADGDLGRIKTQQDFLKAMAEQLLQAKNMTKVNALIDVFKRNVETDLSLENILWFGQSAVLGGLKMEDIHFVTMPNTPKYVYSRSTHGDQSYVVPNPRELLDLVNNELSPFKEVFTLSDLDIMSVNSDGSLRSSTGHVEDSRAASAPVRSSGSGKTNSGKTGTSQGTDTKPNETQTPGDTGPNSETGGNNSGNSSGTGTPGTNQPGDGNPIVVDPNDPYAIPPADPGGTDPDVSTDPGFTTDPGGSTGPNPADDPGNVIPAADPVPEPPAPEPPPAPAPEPTPDPGFTFIEAPPE